MKVGPRNMIRKPLLLIILVAFIIGVSGCGDQAVSAGDHPAFYYFWAKWWTVCAKVNPTVRGLEEKYGRQIEFVWVDIDRAESKELMNRYGIRGIPNVVLLDSSGGKVEQLIGYSPETYEKAILQVLASETSD